MEFARKEKKTESLELKKKKKDGTHRLEKAEGESRWRPPVFVPKEHPGKPPDVSEPKPAPQGEALRQGVGTPRKSGHPSASASAAGPGA